MKVLCIASNRFEQHLTGACPESPDRSACVNRAIKDLHLPIQEPRSASREELALCHTQKYIDLVQEEVEALAPSAIDSLSTGDVVISPKSYIIATLAVGAALEAVDAVMRGRYQAAFSAARPPGHHAESGKGMGFCLFNNAAIAARYAQKEYGIERVLIADWDVHHGNGTQEICEHDKSIYYFSTHSAINYPGTGKTEETGAENTNENHPIHPGVKSADSVKKAFESLTEKMKLFRPQLVIISAGFDAHFSDPIGDFGLTTDDFAILTRLLRQIALEQCEGRLVSLLEGGYNLDTLGKLVQIHLQNLA